MAQRTEQELINAINLYINTGELAQFDHMPTLIADIASASKTMDTNKFAYYEDQIQSLFKDTTRYPKPEQNIRKTKLLNAVNKKKEEGKMMLGGRKRRKSRKSRRKRRKSRRRRKKRKTKKKKKRRRRRRTRR